MTYRIGLYCPDQHISYNLHTLDEVGVGGGITARIRMAHAFAQNGHQVSAYVNCPDEALIDGVQYRHFTNLKDIDAEIAIFSSSGDGLNFRSLMDHTISARIKILFVHGVDLPRNIDLNSIDYIYAPSNFIREIALTVWRIPPEKLFVCHHGVNDFPTIDKNTYPRDIYRLVYSGHPSKGLYPAIKVLRILRQLEPRFSLHVYGGNRLWGGAEDHWIKEPGLVDHGLTGQKQLFHELCQSGFCLNLQTRKEPFGLSVIDAMKAGCVNIASPVGSYPELIADERNGFLIPGDPSSILTLNHAASIIYEMIRCPEYLEQIQLQSMAYPLSWNAIARTWAGHWDWHINHRDNPGLPPRKYFKSCPACNSQWILLEDGSHCVHCGYYQKPATSVQIQMDQLSVAYG